MRRRGNDAGQLQQREISKLAMIMTKKKSCETQRLMDLEPFSLNYDP